MNIEWRKIENWPYEVSSDGQIRRLENRTNTRAGYILKPNGKRNGYLGVTLSRPGKQITGMIHKLVCTAFHGPKPHPKHHAGHLNGNHLQNNAENLAWVTPLENELEKRLRGRHVFGSKHPLAKLNEDDIRTIRSMVKTRRFTHKFIASLFGINKSKISHIISGISWKHIP